jgi:hypothetical protein
VVGCSQAISGKSDGGANSSARGIPLSASRTLPNVAPPLAERHRFVDWCPTALWREAGAMDATEAHDRIRTAIELVESNIISIIDGDDDPNRSDSVTSSRWTKAARCKASEPALPLPPELRIQTARAREASRAVHRGTRRGCVHHQDFRRCRSLLPPPRASHQLRTLLINAGKLGAGHQHSSIGTMAIATRSGGCARAFQSASARLDVAVNDSQGPG